MSAASTYQKFRDADDGPGNMAWAAKMSRKSLSQTPAARSSGQMLEEEYEMSTEERIIWRLLKVPRKYMAVENLGVLPAEKVRGVIRGLIAAEAIDVGDFDAGKPIVPLEVKRHRAKIEGKDTGAKKKGRSKLKARVYRPNISGAPEPAAAPKPAAKPKPVEPPKPKDGAPVTRADLSAEGKQVADLIERLVEKAKDRDWYAFLGVPNTADDGAIKKAYMARARELHPDRVASSGASAVAEVAEHADDLFKKLQNAYALLSDHNKRAEYDMDLASGRMDAAPGGKQRRPEEAKLMLKKGQHLIRTKEYGKAYTQLRMAVDFDDKLIEAQVWCAWALYYHEGKPEAERVDQAKKNLRNVADSTDNAEASYRLALIARIEGHHMEHEKRIKQAVRRDPNHREAMQEKRVLERRRKTGADKAAKDEKKGGLFDRFKR
jgi:tetratricopeptide (TPR) repeat protein